MLNIKNVEEIISFLNNCILKSGLTRKWTDFEEIKADSEHDYLEMDIHTIKGGGYLPRDFYKSVYKNIPI